MTTPKTGQSIWVAVVPTEMGTVAIWSDEWESIQKEDPALAAQIAPLLEAHKREFVLRPYTFKERLEAETAATRITDIGVMFDQWTLVSTLVHAVTGITPSELEQYPASVGSRLWLLIDQVSQLPNWSSWKTLASEPAKPAEAALPRPKGTRTRSSAGRSSGTSGG